MRLSYLSLVRKCLLKMFMLPGDFLSGSNQIKKSLTFSFLVFQVAHVVVVVKCNIERCDVATGVDPVSLSQANPNPMREGKPQDLSAAEN